MCFFFFFKQKTAYEMRISDWSSDVCSSDLHVADIAGLHLGGTILRRDGFHRADNRVVLGIDRHQTHGGIGKKAHDRKQHHKADKGDTSLPVHRCAPRYLITVPRREKSTQRSEEHTSELQPLMRTSYAA